MAFSFNWAGLNVPSVNYVNSMDPEYGKNLGIGARGLENRMAASDFAKKIDAYRQAQNAKAGTNSNRIKEILYFIMTSFLCLLGSASFSSLQEYRDKMH